MAGPTTQGGLEARSGLPTFLLNGRLKSIQIIYLDKPLDDNKHNEPKSTRKNKMFDTIGARGGKGKLSLHLWPLQFRISGADPDRWRQGGGGNFYGPGKSSF